MSDQFKALILNQNGEEFTREIKSIDKSFLKHGDVTIKVDYSDLNFKDGMILKNGGRLVKEFPHIPGIDFSGMVLESENSKFKEGDEVILTGFRVGEIFYGGYSQIAKVNGDFLVKKPKIVKSVFGKKTKNCWYKSQKLQISDICETVVNTRTIKKNRVFYQQSLVKKPKKMERAPNQWFL